MVYVPDQEKPIYKKSNNIKYDKVKKIYFGDTNYEHYFDKLGHYKNLNHLNKERRKAYLRRAKNIRNKKGKLTYKDMRSPNYWSINYLW